MRIRDWRSDICSSYLGPVGAVSTFAALARADKLAAAGDGDAAGRQVIDHLRRNPDEPQGLAKLGEIATHLGALGQAEHFLRKAIARGLASADVRRNLASVLNQQERPEEADRLFATLESEIDDPAVRSEEHTSELQSLMR